MAVAVVTEYGCFDTEESGAEAVLLHETADCFEYVVALALARLHV